jgi:uncharacterized MnhB-related membrane protein
MHFCGAKSLMRFKLRLLMAQATIRANRCCIAVSLYTATAPTPTLDKIFYAAPDVALVQALVFSLLQCKTTFLK